MATIVRQRRLVNPGRKKKLSAKQIKFFGTARQRAALKARQSNPKKRKRNVSSIITIWPKGKSNPGKRKRYVRRNRGKKVVIVNKGEKRMATKKRKRVIHRNRSTRRWRKNYGTQVGRSWSTYATRSKKRNGNPGRRRHRNPGVARYHRRRNPGVLTGTMGQVLGVMGGVGLTKAIVSFLPSTINTGVLGYLAKAAVAVLTGKLAGKFAKSEAFGKDITVGGLAYTLATILNDFIPTVGAYTGISGMGLIGGSNFYVPQVNQNGSMGSFVLPGAVSRGIAASVPVATPSGGMGIVRRGVGSMRRTGRLM